MDPSSSTPHFSWANCHRPGLRWLDGETRSMCVNLLLPGECRGQQAGVLQPPFMWPSRKSLSSYWLPPFGIQNTVWGSYLEKRDRADLPERTHQELPAQWRATWKLCLASPSPYALSMGLLLSTFPANFKFPLLIHPLLIYLPAIHIWRTSLEPLGALTP